MKKSLFLIAVIALVIAVLPFSLSAQSDSITLWTSLDITNTEEARAVSLAAFIAQFEADSGITVNVETVAWDQITTRLAIAVTAGGDVPDLVEISSQQIPQLLDAGALMPLDDLLADQPWLGQLSAGDTNACVIDDVRVCVANTVRGGITYYRAADFPNGFPTTAEEALAYADGGLAEGREYFTTFFSGRSYGAIEVAWWPLIASNGGSLFDEEGRPNWASAEVAEVVEYGRALLQSGLLPEASVTGEFADAEAPWIDGVSMSFSGGSWSGIFVPGLREAVDAGEVMLAPGFDFGGGRYVFLNSESWVVPEGAANPEGAAAFISAFMTPEFVAEWAESNFGVPTLGGSDSAASPFFAQVDAILGGSGLYMQQSPYYVESLDTLAIAWQELLLDPAIPALERLQAAQDEVLQQYW
ncbi:MAG: extracellular solute-binding protein [bacterium]|nr:extracellular solute-binding protein [bacterium]